MSTDKATLPEAVREQIDELQRIANDLLASWARDAVLKAADDLATAQQERARFVAALMDCYVLLPPERVRLIRQPTKDTIDVMASHPPPTQEGR